MRLLIAALLSVALIQVAPAEKPPVNNLGLKVAQTAKAEKLTEVKEADVTDQAVEEPAAPTPEVQPEQVSEPAPVETPAPEAQPTPVPGTHEEMMAAAGIPTSDWAAVEYIVSHESTWNPTAVNASSGSCGLVQELPCGKSGCTFGDGVCQLRWATQYATGRYGSWWGAHSFWVAQHWW